MLYYDRILYHERNRNLPTRIISTSVESINNPALYLPTEQIQENLLRKDKEYQRLQLEADEELSNVSQLL